MCCIHCISRYSTSQARIILHTAMYNSVMYNPPRTRDMHGQTSAPGIPAPWESISLGGQRPRDPARAASWDFLFPSAGIWKNPCENNTLMCRKEWYVLLPIHNRPFLVFLAHLLPVALLSTYFSLCHPPAVLQYILPLSPPSSDANP